MKSENCIARNYSLYRILYLISLVLCLVNEKIIFILGNWNISFYTFNHKKLQYSNS